MKNLDTDSPIEEATTDSQARTLKPEDLKRIENVINDFDDVEGLEKYLVEQFGIDPELTAFLKEAGVGGILKLREFYHEAVAFDLKYGTKTTEYVSEQLFKDLAENNPDQFVEPENANHTVKHRPSVTSSIVDSLTHGQRILQRNGVSTEDTRFVDLGSGSGKLLVVAKHPDFGFQFKKAVGVDFYKGLVDLAQGNITNAGLDDTSIELVHGNAGRFRDYNGVNMIASYNSMDGAVMKHVERNARKYAGRAIFAYIKPLQREFFESAEGGKFWRLEVELGSEETTGDKYDPDKHIAIYSHGFE